VKSEFAGRVTNVGSIAFRDKQKKRYKIKIETIDTPFFVYTPHQK